MNFSSKTRILIAEQTWDWDLAAANYKGLEQVKSKTVELPGGSTIVVQFNPERIRSSAAKVDAKSIQERPCFLCEKNRPAQQVGLTFGDNYTVLINPFPIFPEHLTIPRDHTDQLIAPHFTDMVELARALDDFTIFYNGPKCGASAPDHFHFQAGIKNFMPIEADYRSGKYTQAAGEVNGVKLETWHHYNRGVLSLVSADEAALVDLFNKIYNLLAASQPDEAEPMLNLLAYFENGQWILHLFPRILHRPACYFAEGEAQLLISPASVDMGGVFITPREEDFNKITGADVADILNQVCMSEQEVMKLVKAINC